MKNPRRSSKEAISSFILFIVLIIINWPWGQGLNVTTWRPVGELFYSIGRTIPSFIIGMIFSFIAFRRKIISKRVLFGLIIAIIWSVIGLGVNGSNRTQSSIKKDSEQIGNNLLEISKLYNKELPTMLDKSTMLVRTSAGPGNKFSYFYKLVNLEKKDIDISKLKKLLRSHIISGLRTSPDLKYFKDNFAEMVCIYKDKHDVLLFEIVVKPEEFK